MYVCLCPCVCMYVYRCTCMRVCVLICVCACVSICRCVCMYVCRYTSMCVSVDVCACMCADTHAPISVCWCVQVHMHGCACMWISVSDIRCHLQSCLTLFEAGSLDDFARKSTSTSPGSFYIYFLTAELQTCTAFSSYGSELKSSSLLDYRHALLSPAMGLNEVFVFAEKGVCQLTSPQPPILFSEILTFF